MLDLVSLGELLIDFTPVGISEHNNPIFERNPGGGPANMLCAASKLGLTTGFIGQVGDDAFGHALRRTLQENKIDTANLLLSKQYKTTLAFVHLDEAGDRSFSFYRKNGADTMLRWSGRAAFSLAPFCCPRGIPGRPAIAWRSTPGNKGR